MCSFRSIMPRQDELAFMKAISTLQVSPALLKELRLAVAPRKKKVAVPAGGRSTTLGSRTRASQQLAGKRKANELASSGDSMEPALALGPFLCPRPNSHGRTSCCRQPATRTIRGRGNVRGYIGRARRPV